MRIRADIAALVREGHSDTSIAARLGCHRNTAGRVRKALRYPAAEPLSRLYAEAVPTGRVTAPVGRLPLSPERQAANRAALLAALREAA